MRYGRTFLARFRRTLTSELWGCAYDLPAYYFDFKRGFLKFELIEMGIDRIGFYLDHTFFFFFKYGRSQSFESLLFWANLHKEVSNDFLNVLSSSMKFFHHIRKHLFDDVFLHDDFQVFSIFLFSLLLMLNNKYHL
uniref:Uncharacterized protein n=1 Tax=Cacopsylla melanoneura TaxID=428564 RepID=A0A8D8Z5H7_9HEMI